MTKLPSPHPLAGDSAYGDNPVALQRLLLLAKVFAPCSNELLGRLPIHEPDVAIDLGCGPGETTRLLFNHFPQAKTIGIDASPEFVRAASKRQPRAISFVVGDVTKTPFPCAPADLIYARLLLAHLRQPTAVVSSWTRQLRPGGLLALEEVERIVTEDQLFQDYLQIAASALRVRGTELYIGPTLDRMEPPAGVKMISSVRAFQPATQDVATMFALNLETLRRDETIEADYGQRELTAIARALNVRAKETCGPPISWEMRQVVLVKGESRGAGPHSSHGPQNEPQGAL